MLSLYHIAHDVNLINYHKPKRTDDTRRKSRFIKYFQGFFLVIIITLLVLVDILKCHNIAFFSDSFLFIYSCLPKLEKLRVDLCTIILQFTQNVIKSIHFDGF